MREDSVLDRGPEGTIFQNPLGWDRKMMINIIHILQYLFFGARRPLQIILSVCMADITVTSLSAHFFSEDLFVEEAACRTFESIDYDA